MTDNSPKLFWPEKLGPYTRAISGLLIQLQESQTRDEQAVLIRALLENLPSYPNSIESKLRCRTYLLVLADLIRQEWEPTVDQGRLFLRPPDVRSAPKDEGELNQQKGALQRLLTVERNAQLGKPSVRQFVTRMERTRSHKGRKVSICSLLANGPMLAKQLGAALAVADADERAELVKEVVRPYLQIVTPDEVCAYSGYRLSDIWRYFRHTWSTPYNPTPGRQMFYLVRDAGQPMHPIIGIAALGSSIIQLTVRDDVIGWTPSAFGQRISPPAFNDQDARRVANSLRETLRTAIADLYTRDLVTARELRSPTSDTLNSLAIAAQESKDRRMDLLQLEAKGIAAQDQGQALKHGKSKNGTQSPDGVELTQKAKQALYRHKRARVLRSLLEAKRVMDAAGPSLDKAQGLKDLWATKVGKLAISTLLRENKKRRVGSNIMDIIVCGAIPPYNTLLGGKLVAMLLASPQVAFDYQSRYADYASLIASEMKGKPVRRDSRLVFLGTTSLYAVGSSQYNRISIPIPNDLGAKLQYERYGLTLGYGSVHFSEETVTALVQLQERVQQARLIHNRFGEGVNPKLRRIRAGLDALGVVSDDYLQHRTSRIVYGVALGRKSFEFLRGEVDDPGLYFNINTAAARKRATQYITNYWISRWLSGRISKPEYLEQVKAFRPESILLSHQLTDQSDGEFIQGTLSLE